VEITIGGLAVSVEAAAPLNTVAKKAMELWREANNPRLVGAGATTVGFAASEPAGSALLPPELALPYHLQPGAPDDDRQTRRP
jgi:hypothetical protein